MHSKFIKPLSKEEFESKVKNASNVVVVDFGADWCPPCKALVPTLEKVSESYKERVTVYSVDTEKDGELAADFNVRGLPTVIVFRDGVQMETIVGRRSYEEYESVLNSLLGPANKD